MKQRHSENKRLYDRLEKKIDTLLAKTLADIEQYVLIEHQHLYQSTFQEKLKIQQNFILLCKSISSSTKATKAINKEINSIVTGKIEQIEAFAKWYKETLLINNQDDVVEGTIIQLMNNFFTENNQLLNTQIKQLLDHPDIQSNPVIVNKVKQLNTTSSQLGFEDADWLENQVVSMSKELKRNTSENQKLNKLLVKTMVLTNAESGTIYLLKENALYFLLIFNHAMEMNSMESEKLAQKFPPIQLYNPKTGKVNIRYISVYTALKNQVLNIRNLADFKSKISAEIGDVLEEKVGPDLYQQKTGYRGKTFLCAPIHDKKGAVIGVIQLSNRIDTQTGKIISFSHSQENLISKIAQLAADPLEKRLPKTIFFKSILNNATKLLHIKRSSLNFYKQLDEMDCGPTCLKMVTKYYGKSYSSHFFREKCYISNQGVTMRGLSEAAESIGFRTEAYFISINELYKDFLLPCIANWGDNHFIVIYKVEKDVVWIADPATGLNKFSKKDFKQEWDIKNENQFIAVLTLEPTPFFYSSSDSFQSDKTNLKVNFIFNYLKPFKSILVKSIVLFLILVLASIIPPFLIEAIVDYGIEFKNEELVYVILGAQLILFFGLVVMTIFSSWLSFQVSKKINMSLMSDFINRLLQLNVAFFDVKTRGDILQRIADNNKIKYFLSNTTVESLLNSTIIICFSIILLIYNSTIFFVFAGFTTLSILWSVFMIKKRKQVNIKRFEQSSNLQSMLIEMLEGIYDIKVNSIEKEIRWRWKSINLNYESAQQKWLVLKQIQKTGNDTINQLNNILITFLSVILVIQGEISLGAMMAIQFIIGQLSRPTTQFFHLISIIQENIIALERLSSVHLSPIEAPLKTNGRSNEIQNKNISISNVAFHYTGSQFKAVLNNINLFIPEKKITAIVGKSGSGKSTLLKLLYKFYLPTKGMIDFGEVNLNDLDYAYFRSKCGVVLQDGYIFSDTIEGNICLNQGKINNKRFMEVVKVACIDEFIHQCENGYDTKIGNNGMALSKGQCQRIFIARALYKNPDILILDEATAALDAAIEKKIISNIKKYCRYMTIIIVAHRLSMIKGADQIAVLNNGEISEYGKHVDLLLNKRDYYHLIKDQIDN